jgi:cation-transporting ATPase 13A1
VTAQSSVRVTSKIGYKAAKSFTTASHVLVYAAKNAGKSVIVKLCKGNPEAVVKIGGREYEAASVNFEFQKITYNFDVKNQKFTQQDYLYSNSLINYLNYEGFSRLDDLIIAHRKWGNNEYDIPLPSFMDLYKVQYVIL